MLAAILATVVAQHRWMPNADHQFRTTPDGFVRIASETWQIRYRRYLDSPKYVGQFSEPDEEIRVLKNGKRVFDVSLDGYLTIIRASTPAPFPVFILKRHSTMGHGEITWMFGIRSEIFFQMGKFAKGEIGGPIYRDLDRDGKLEWIFDDYDWYTYAWSPPKWVYAYKLKSDGRLRFWKKLKANLKESLPRDRRFFL
jgi:hypothetical protein